MITLSTRTARLIMVDLLEGDRAKEEVEIYRQEVETYQAIESKRDSIDILRYNEINSLQKILDMTKIENQGKTQEIERLNKDLRRQIAFKNVFATTTGVAAIGLIISLLIH